MSAKNTGGLYSRAEIMNAVTEMGLDHLSIAGLHGETHEAPGRIDVWTKVSSGRLVESFSKTRVHGRVYYQGQNGALSRVILRQRMEAVRGFADGKIEPFVVDSKTESSAHASLSAAIGKAKTLSKRERSDVYVGEIRRGGLHRVGIARSGVYHDFGGASAHYVSGKHIARDAKDFRYIQKEARDIQGAVRRLQKRDASEKRKKSSCGCKG